MPLIATTIYSKGKIRGLLVACSPKRYAYYMEHNEQPEYTISSGFLKEFLSNKGFASVKVDETSKNIVAGETAEGRTFVWEDARSVDVYDVKEILSGFNLSYHEFVDAYTEKLKSL